MLGYFFIEKGPVIKVVKICLLVLLLLNLMSSVGMIATLQMKNYYAFNYFGIDKPGANIDQLETVQGMSILQVEVDDERS